MNKYTKFSVIILSAFLSILSSCSKNDVLDNDNVEKGFWETYVPFKTNYNTFTLPFTDQFNPIPEEKGRVEMSEASGIACSVTNPGKIWAHNDSGHPNRLFLIDQQTGEIVATYQVDGTHNIDWEDIEVSVGPIDGDSYLYVSDTGDNDQKRSNYSVYRFVEPKYEPAHYGKNIAISNAKVDRIQFKYPGGSQDTESLLVDPLTKDIFLVTKRSVVSQLYVIPYPQKVNETYEIYKAGEFSFREASAATCSLDGKKVLIKNRQEIFYWERAANESMVEMLARTPVIAPYVGEIQGEAVCFDAQHNYFTLSEKANALQFPMLYKYNLKK